MRIETGVETNNGFTYPTYGERLKHDALVEGAPHCNYFSFLMPEKLADNCEIPDHAGLYVYRENSRTGKGRVFEVKSAPKLHKRKITDETRYAIARKMCYRYWNMVTPHHRG